MNYKQANKLAINYKEIKNQIILIEKKVTDTKFGWMFEVFFFCLTCFF